MRYFHFIIIFFLLPLKGKLFYQSQNHFIIFFLLPLKIKLFHQIHYSIISLVFVYLIFIFLSMMIFFLIIITISKKHFLIKTISFFLFAILNIHFCVCLFPIFRIFILIIPITLF